MEEAERVMADIEGPNGPGLGADGTTAPVHVRYRIFENKNAYMGAYTDSDWRRSEFSEWTETKQFGHE